MINLLSMKVLMNKSMNAGQNQPANGFACIVTLLMRFSTKGLYVFGLTANFSNSSSASKPSIIRPGIINRAIEIKIVYSNPLQWIIIIHHLLKENCNSSNILLKLSRRILNVNNLKNNKCL